ncbi:DUF885 domain-containing protein [Ornithinimicrobium faecis]|uniref:DUF885 domain-containing protein n=1 Tax=Ornithinimicrobium faecis TaxID=2934158 RepID=A0ABY4YQ36_9MICO|nr:MULTISPECIES: DUF885 domain-containing protein [unclassified Ornithinimicrobium]USQ78666.1 DUF885 domain-containing protein [Ornithinimicrobium sp. HY1793]
MPAAGTSGSHPTLENYATWVHESEPLSPASVAQGLWHGQLPSRGIDSATDRAEQLRGFLRTFDDVSVETDDDRLDLATSRIDATHRLRELEEQRPWARVPYLYVEEAGNALQKALQAGEHGEADSDVLATCLAALPDYLAHAGQNLDAKATPPAYVEAARSALTGLNDLLDQADAGAAPRDAVAGFSTALEDLQGRAAGSWAAGRDYLDHCLNEYFLVDTPVDELADWGHEQVRKDQERLRAHAAQTDPGRDWQQQIQDVRADHPEPDEVLDTYRMAMERSRAHTLEHDLATILPGEDCRIDVVPDFLRPTAPMGFMDLAPAWGPSLSSALRITPIRTVDGAPDPDHLAENCHALITTIAGHETYPGHHLQRVHHKRATEGNTSIRRTFFSALFVEGWGLYVEDMMRETGYMDTPGLVLYALRNSLWRSVRVVVDVGLHTGTMSQREAVDYLMSEASLGRHIAEGEVRRYIRHDNPSYPSAYALGREGFHRLRAEWERAGGSTTPLRGLHDAIMSFGSVPHALIRGDVLALAAGSR